MSFVPPENYTEDEAKIWKVLMYNDFHAFCKGDWEMIANDFDQASFCAIQGNKSNNKLDWNLQYNSLEAYQTDWLQQSKEFLKNEFLRDPLKVLFESTQLSKIEINGDVALVHKEFDGEFQRKDAPAIVLDWISLFLLKKKEDQWKIFSFVGYLPRA